MASTKYFYGQVEFEDDVFVAKKPVSNLIYIDAGEGDVILRNITVEGNDLVSAHGIFIRRANKVMVEDCGFYNCFCSFRTYWDVNECYIANSRFSGHRIALQLQSKRDEVSSCHFNCPSKGLRLREMIPSGPRAFELYGGEKLVSRCVIEADGLGETIVSKVEARRAIITDTSFKIHNPGYTYILPTGKPYPAWDTAITLSGGELELSNCYISFDYPSSSGIGVLNVKNTIIKSNQIFNGSVSIEPARHPVVNVGEVLVSDNYISNPRIGIRTYIPAKRKFAKLEITGNVIDVSGSMPDIGAYTGIGVVLNTHPASVIEDVAVRLNRFFCKPGKPAILVNQGVVSNLRMARNLARAGDLVFVSDKATVKNLVKSFNIIAFPRENAWLAKLAYIRFRAKQRSLKALYRIRDRLGW